ncbi:alpha/beta fold hydrolase [Gryllotalpicola protaetiae]|uniref:Alpha/beta fold hydrolase n=1 Tax=Gryllotalpicola protaetiae TaxID=2419771 RepID=A0A387BSL9_9MICO|nr:alpha/beta fold hydrolase [Gryllotalpicola protaetiae]AYG03937.1 alpha/beta fold hydrolase [Gryllotalpicola protaetiae]
MVVENPYYTEAVHGPFQLAGIGDLELESGVTLSNVELAYQTVGELNPAKDNVVLIPTWFSGTHGVMRDAYVGAGRALDPEKYFIVLVNQIGSGLGTSPHNRAGAFPLVSIGDDVVAQERLLRDNLGVERIALVFGASMGAMQAYEWAVRYPERVERLGVIAGTARVLPRQIIWTQVMTDALTSDVTYANGDYVGADAVKEGLSRLSWLFGLQLVGREVWLKEHWRGFGFDSFQGFLSGFLGASLAPMDANDLISQASKWSRADVSRHTDGDLAAALGRVSAATTVMAIRSDMMFPPVEVEPQGALVPGSRFLEIDDDFGHASLFGLTPSCNAQIDAALGELLERDRGAAQP